MEKGAKSHLASGVRIVFHNSLCFSSHLSRFSFPSLVYPFRYSLLYYSVCLLFFYEDLFCSLRHDANLLRHIMIIVKSFSSPSIAYFPSGSIPSSICFPDAFFYIFLFVCFYALLFPPISLLFLSYTSCLRERNSGTFCREIFLPCCF